MEQTLKENWLKKKQIKWAIENPKQYQEWKNKNEEKVYEKKKEQSKIYREKNKEELKEKRSEIIDKKRINIILRNIKKKSKKSKIDTQITLKVWKIMNISSNIKKSLMNKN